MTSSRTTVNVKGRLSFPKLTMDEALAANAANTQYKKDPANVAPSFGLLLDEIQLDKVIDFLRTEIIPPAVARYEADNEAKNSLPPKHAEKILELLENRNFEDQPPYIPIKAVSEKTLELMPDAQAVFQINGLKGRDLTQLAIVRKEEELKIPDADLLQYPVLKDLSETMHELYPGAMATATVDFYAYPQKPFYGINAQASTCIFHSDAPRFGGGVEVDPDIIFED